MDLPTFDDVMNAAHRIAPHAHRTPIFTSRSLDALAGASLYFKCENLQRVGAFKFRGACNAVFSLDDATAAAGVATHSSGNHAQALALAARIRGIAAHIVMPKTAPAVKVAAVEGYGAEIVFCEPTLASRETTLADVLAATGAHAVHPYDDARVIAGQGTAALELFDEVPDLDVVTVPVGGGGLLAGTALTARAVHPEVKVIAAEPAQADDAARSFREGRIVPSEDRTTIADGLRTSLGLRNFAIIRGSVDDIVTVSEDAIIRAMRLFIERTKLVIEPSAAVPVAAVLGRQIRGGRIGVVLSGGNVDIGKLPFQSVAF